MIPKINENLLLTRSRFIKQKDFWSNKLTGDMAETKLFNSNNRNGRQHKGRDKIIIPIPDHVGQAAIKMGKQSAISIYIILLAVIKSLIYRYSGNEDVTVISPIFAERRTKETMNHYVFTRDWVTGDMTFKELLLTVKQSLLDAYDHQDYPLDRIVEKLSNFNRDDARGKRCISNVVCSLKNIHSDRLLKDEDEDNLIFHFSRRNGSIDGSLWYDPELYNTGTAAQVKDHFVNLLTEVLQNLDEKISRVGLLSSKERKCLLYEFNSMQPAYSRDKCIHHLFAEQVERTPDNVAVVHRGNHWTYRVLNERSHQVAAALQQRGVKPDSIVGLMVEPSPEMLMGIMGILKAGGAYLPIDLRYPHDRIKTILNDSRVDIVITHKPLMDHMDYGDTVTVLDIGSPGIYERDASGLGDWSQPGSLAYVIYTSGSTGKPKGILIEHGNVTAYVNTFLEEFRLTSRDTVIQQASLSFDAFVEEIFPILTRGGKIAIPQEYEILDMTLLSRFISKNNITLISCSPLLLKELNEIGPLRGITTFISGGDRLKTEHVNHLIETGNVYNTYGPTETTVCATYYKYSTLSGPNVPIGKPISNYKVYIRDKNKQLVPIGVPGEICITGAGLARGYLNQPGLTAEKFVVSSPGEEKERMYCTGDLGRWLPDGNIEFLDRIDHQVKIRGYRIELGEIETQLKTHPQIKEAVTLVKEDEAGDKFLCAYYTASTEICVSGLREHLAVRLPDYMIPSYFMQLGKIPFTPGGKLDRRGLPAPVAKSGAAYAAPGNNTEKKLVLLWARVLDIDKDKIGIDDNFFELGGHSLKAIVLASEIHKEFNVRVPLKTIFDLPTLREFTQYIGDSVEERFTSIEPVEKKDYYPLSPAQKRLYIMQQVDLESTGYNMPETIYLDKDFDRIRLEIVFRELTRRHESLRTSFEIVNEEPVQKIHEAGDIDFVLEYFETLGILSDGPEPAGGESPYGQIIENFVRPFDLSNAPLLRVGLIGTPPHEKDILLVDMHHIISDGTSHQVLEEEFNKIYNGERLPELSLQYKDFTQWQNSKREQERLKAQEKYWLKEFSCPDDLPVLKLPTDFIRPALHRFEGNIVQFVLDRTETGIMKRIAKETDMTLFMISLAISNVLLAKLSGQEDIIVGTAISGRRHADLQQIIGMFVNTLPIRNFPSGKKTFKQFLTEVKQRALAAFENQEYQLEDLIDRLNIERNSNRHPLFNVVVTLFSQEDYNGEPLEYSEEQELVHKKGRPKFDISISAVEFGEYLNFVVEYCTELFKPRTIERFIRYFRKIISEAGVDINGKISGIEMISDEEKEQLLVEFNHTKRDYPKEKTIRQLFEEQVVKTPGRVALVGKSEAIPDHVSLTYKELNQRANQLANVLRRKGAKPDTMVGLMIDRTIEMIISIMAILKAGSAYLPIKPDSPQNRILSKLEDCNVTTVLTTSKIVDGYSFARLQGLQSKEIKPQKTAARPIIKDFDGLPFVDRSLIDNEKYNRFIGHGMVKNSVTLQATRGCPYDCAFCCRVWPRKLTVRSAESIFEEVKMYYNMGMRRFVFIDDIFNFDNRNSRRFFELVIENNLDIHILFPSGLRGDILTKDYIDLMIKAGTISFPLSLETASPRLQKLIKKNLDLKKFRENIEYIIEKYPHVILELNTIHGLPTETEEEARMTLDFIKSLKYVHFPYVHILRIHSNTYMQQLALENGISMKAIQQSRDMFYHELPDTLPFDKSFTLKYQAEFLNEYFLSKERLLHILPFQMKTLTEDEIVQKYNSYLPTPIRSFSDLLEFVNIKEEELGVKEFADEKQFFVDQLDEKMRRLFPADNPPKDALRVLLLDLSQFYSHESETLYNVVEQPLGLMYVMSYLKQQYGEKINGKIAKSRIDFDSDDELRQLLEAFNPDVIGIRTLTNYRDFFHRTIAKIRQRGFAGAIIAGGPYATVDFNTLLHDRNIDFAVLGEGEITFAEVIAQILENGGQLPGKNLLERIPGLAFMPRQEANSDQWGREILVVDSCQEVLAKEPVNNLPNINQSSDLAYIAYTSGSTGKPKGVMVEHKNVGRLVKNTNYIDIKPSDNILQLSNYAFDGSVFDIYGALLNGSKLLMIKEEDLLDVDRLSAFIRAEQITVFFVTTALFNVLVDTHIECFDDIRHVLFGGERVSFEHVKQAVEYMGPNRIIHVYGPTETTVYATYHYIRELDENLKTVPIGQPLANTTAYILDKTMKPVPIGAAGEIYIGGDAVTRGYLNHEELTREKFVSSLFVDDDRLYKTGDRARWLPNGHIEFLGRIDSQVKLRGFRIEMGEIEAELSCLEEIRAAVVMVKENTSKDKYLCAYVVLEKGTPLVDFAEIKGRLLKNLPDYMIPTYFVQLEKIPLNVNGKVNKKVLPDPEVVAGEDYIAPRNNIERKLVEIWSDVLHVKKEAVGINANFFELGGHSLKSTILAAKIYKELHVKVPMVEIFRNQTIMELSEYIQSSKRSQFVSIESAEKREYYELSSAQKRLYIQQQMDPASTSYNIPKIMWVEGDLRKEKLEAILLKLIARHESLRTSFQVIDRKPFQRIHDPVDIDFTVAYYKSDEEESRQLIAEFVRPFALDQAPLLRAELLEIDREKYILMLDMHHVITDGTSQTTFVNEFVTLYKGKELPLLRLQYKDFSQWNSREEQEEVLKKQEEYWEKQFEGEIPLLELPGDFPRSTKRSFTGDTLDFEIGADDTAALKKWALEENVTLFMLLLAVYYVFLGKLSGQEDIVVGTGTLGRSHPDLAPIIGMFINTLALRNYPCGDKKFRDFLQEIKENTLNAFENQDYQFDDLVDQVVKTRHPNRNPLFDVGFIIQNFESNTAEIPDLKLKTLPYNTQVPEYDLYMVGIEAGDKLNFHFNYSREIFKQETSERFIGYFKEIVSCLPGKKDSKINDIKISHDLEDSEITALQIEFGFSEVE